MTTSDGTSNYRDVGEALGLWLDPSPIRSGALLRGGKLDTLTTAAEIGHPRTILNLRQGPDPKQLEGVTYLHVPAANEVENYDTTLREVRAWLGKALAVLSHPDTAWPVYVHCTSGRDRTGLVVASTLFFLGLPRDVIIEEFLLSEGAERSLIEGALVGIANAQATSESTGAAWKPLFCVPPVPVHPVRRLRFCRGSAPASTAARSRRPRPRREVRR